MPKRKRKPAHKSLIDALTKLIEDRLLNKAEYNDGAFATFVAIFKGTSFTREQRHWMVCKIILAGALLPSSSPSRKKALQDIIDDLDSRH